MGATRIVLSSTIMLQGCLIVVPLLLFAGRAEAQSGTLYKCKGSDGVMAYQQQPCAASDVPSGEVHYQEDAGTSDPGTARDTMFRNLYGPQGRPGRSRGAGSAPSPQPYSTPGQPGQALSAWERDELLRRLRNRESSLSSLQGSSAFDRSRRSDLQREIALIRAQLALPQASPSSVPSRVKPTGPDPNRPFREGWVQDQHGNRYFRPEGSHMVIDQRTGKPCLAIDGVTIRCDQ